MLSKRNCRIVRLAMMPFKKWSTYACLALLFAFAFVCLPKPCLGHGQVKTITVDALSLWATALGSTVVISVVPLIVLFFIPIENKDEHQPLLRILLSFASGGLLGDACMHLIPHSLVEFTLNGGSETLVGMWILIGILTFFFIEKMVRIVKGGHSHSHSSAQPKEKMSDDEDGVNNASVSHSVGPKQSLSVTGWLNIIADFMHNFTDGLAIGTGYLAGQNIGLATSITVLLHEVPHEIGDYAILIQQGSTKANAMKCQLVTALGAVCGTMVSLTFGKNGVVAHSWVLPFTAGSFIYIATVNVIPSLLKRYSYKQSIKETVALLVGIFLMVLVAKYE